VFGAATSLVIAYALARGDGHYMYEALAREKDAPHRTRFIVEPYLATLSCSSPHSRCWPAWGCRRISR